MKLISLIILSSLFGFATAHAGQCYNAFKEAKSLEKIVSDVYFISETDDKWAAFASWEPIKKINASEIRRVLNLGSTYESQAAYFSMGSANSLYNFLNNQIENFGPDGYDEADSRKKLEKLKSTISKKYGKKVRLIMFGNGDGDSYFSGDHMIILIDDNGCVLGLKAMTAWT